MKPDLLGGSPSKRRDRQIYSLREQKRRRVEDQEPEEEEEDTPRSPSRARRPSTDIDAGTPKRIKLYKDLSIGDSESPFRYSGLSSSTLAQPTSSLLDSRPKSSAEQISRSDVKALFIVDDDFVFSTLEASVEYLYKHYEEALPLDRRRSRQALKDEVVHLLYSEEVKLVSEVGQRAALRSARSGSGLIKFNSRYVQYVPIQEVVMRRDSDVGTGIWWSSRSAYDNA